MDKEYSNKMIEAFIDKPSVTIWYQNAFNKFDITGIDKLKWHWSWWAFGGGFLYLLYRKQYLPSLILFILSSIVGMLFPLSLVVMILSGGYATFFVYKGYKKKLSEIENTIEDERVKLMREVGGYNQWVIWIYIAIISILFLFILSMMSSLLY